MESNKLEHLAREAAMQKRARMAEEQKRQECAGNAVMESAISRFQHAFKETFKQEVRNVFPPCSYDLREFHDGSKYVAVRFSYAGHHWEISKPDLVSYWNLARDGVYQKIPASSIQKKLLELIGEDVISLDKHGIE
jgi:hypothetical protein